MATNVLVHMISDTISFFVVASSFAVCHSERSEESHTAQDKLRDRRISFRTGSGMAILVAGYL